MVFLGCSYGERKDSSTGLARVKYFLKYFSFFKKNRINLNTSLQSSPYS